MENDKRYYESITSKPPWLRIRINNGELFTSTSARIKSHKLHTVCESAACPNMGHCWACGRATIMILGNRCTRACKFCNVDKLTVLPPDLDEPRRVAEAVRESGLSDVVITSVTRDDLGDGGAALWAETVQRIYDAVPGIHVEVLVPDFKGVEKDIDTVLEAKPGVFGHNLETAPRLYSLARPQANYQQSLDVLRYAKNKGFITKTSLMLGLGESYEETLEVLRDGRKAGVDILFMGQYLRPTEKHAVMEGYLTPEYFALLKRDAEAMGYGYVASSPLVRSSYHEEGQTIYLKGMQNV